jgi:cation:H+ antiporter
MSLRTGWWWIGAAGAATAPGLMLRLGVFALPDVGQAILFGSAIVAAAFLLSWTAKVAQMDFSQGLALALLALIAVLPEYVVDGTLAWMAATDPAYGSYAVANMTGANRLLIGVAWPLVVVVAFLRFGRRHVQLERGHGIELTVLLAATLYAFLIPLKSTLSFLDLGILFALFVLYMWLVARLPAEQPHLVGPARAVGALPTGRRRLVTAVLGLVATIVILLVAKPFARALVAAGTQLGMNGT